MIKRNFYIIGHNPNSTDEARDFLLAGANALEPDIKHFPNLPHKFYVSHDGLDVAIHTGASLERLSLQHYLKGLRTLLTKNVKTRNLALLYFDVKDPDFDINQFLQVVHDNFSKFPICSGVAVLVEASSLDDVGFLNKYDQKRPRVGISIGEENSPKDVLASFRKHKQSKIGFGNGIFVAGVKPEVFHSITKAKFLQVTATPHFRFIYTWVMASEDSMRSYLELHIDGIVVNINTVKTLKSLLKEKRLKGFYKLAPRGHNPWTATPPPQYALTIKTRDESLAGTGSRILFKLRGKKGYVTAILDGGYHNMTERGFTNFTTLEGKDVGALISLSVTLLDGGAYSGWLPQWVKVQGPLLAKSHTFKFTEDDWLEQGKTITKVVK